MIGTILLDENGKPLSAPSAFQPSSDVIDITKRVRDDFFVGDDIQRRPFEEFNLRSFLQELDENQRRWNVFQDSETGDPDEDWRWFGNRPDLRNKLISIAAHFITLLIIPGFVAQNDQDDEDKAAARTIKDLVEWNIRNSDYPIKFLLGVIGGLVNPISYFNVQFIEKMTTMKERMENGEVSKKEVVDELVSGIRLFTVPPEEIFISDAYTFNIQEQRFLIRRRFVEWGELESIYGDHPNWAHVTPGQSVLFNDDDGQFYDQKDDDLILVGEEVVYYNRRDDVEIPFVTGIYMGDDDVDANMMKHRRVFNVDGEVKLLPVYPFAKFGYEPIDEGRFFFYKSAANKLGPEQELIDRFYKIAADGALLDAIPALAKFGDSPVTAGTLSPGAITSFGINESITKLETGRNLGSTLGMIGMLEDQQSRSSRGNIAEGQLPDPRQKAFNVARAEANDRRKLGIFGNMIADAVVQVGSLMVDLIVTHQTVGEVEEILAGQPRLKFRSFLLSDKTEGSKKSSKKIVFSSDLIGRNMTKREKEKMENELLKKAENIDKDAQIILVNPEKFSRLRFLAYVSPDTLTPKNEAIQDALRLEAYDRAIQNPLVAQNPDNLKNVTRDLLFGSLDATKDDPDKYLGGNVVQNLLQAQQTQTQNRQTGTSRFVEQATGENSLSEILARETE